MALDFLLNLLSTIPRIKSNFEGSATPYLAQQEALAAKQAGIGDALMDPNNPLYKQKFAENKGRNQQSMAATIAEAQAQNRLNTRMGRTPLFDPSRGGETLFRSLIQANQGADATASQQARADLTQAGQAYGSGLNAYSNLTPYGASRNLQQNMGYDGIAALLRGNNQASGAGGATDFGKYTPTAKQVNWNSERLDPSQFY